MNDDKISKSVKAQCDKVRLFVASQLPAIAERFASAALDEESPSVAHAKFILELLALQPPAPAEKKTKSDESSEDPDAGERSGTQALFDRLGEMMVESEDEPFATTLP